MSNNDLIARVELAEEALERQVFVPVVFIGPDTERPGWTMFVERRCGHCGRTMVSPQPEPKGNTIYATCPRRHESEIVEAPEGFERYTDMERLNDLAKMREAEAWAL